MVFVIMAALIAIYDFHHHLFYIPIALYISLSSKQHTTPSEIPNVIFIIHQNNHLKQTIHFNSTHVETILNNPHLNPPISLFCATHIIKID
jgi:hypothetical protein